MTFEFDYDTEPQNLTVTTSGDADVPGFKRLMAALVSDERYRSDLAILIDHTALNLSTLSDGDVEAIAEAGLEVEWSYPARAVAMVASPKDLERARMVFAHLGGSKSGRRVFGSRDEAVAWLGGQ